MMFQYFAFCFFIASYFAHYVEAAGSCSYQFTIPESSGVKCDGMNMKTTADLEHVKSELYMTTQRQNMITQNFMNKLTALDADSRDMKVTTRQVQSDVMALQGAMDKLQSVIELSQEIQNATMASKQALEPKFQHLQETMIDLVHQMQSQFTQLTKDVKEQIAAQSTKVQALSDLSKITEQLNGKLSDQNDQQTKLIARLEAVEDKINVEPPYEVTIARLKSQLDIMQKELFSSHHQNRDRISELESQLNAQKEELNALKSRK